MKLINTSKLIVALCIIIIVWFSGCSKDPTSPEEKEVDDAIATQTIDASGGTIETENFKLEVPSGAFSNGVELKLYEVSDNTSDENSVTKTYQLKGLPEKFAKPLKIAVKYIGTLKNESYIRVEQKMFFEETGDTLNFSNLIPAIDSSGFLQTQLPLRPSISLPKPNSNEMVDLLDIITVGGWSDFLSSNSAHFQL